MRTTLRLFENQQTKRREKSLNITSRRHAVELSGGVPSVISRVDMWGWGAAVYIQLFPKADC